MPDARTAKEKDVLVKAFQGIKFLRENYTDPNTFIEFIQNVCDHLTYRFVPAG